MRFVDQTFPLLVCVFERNYEQDEVEQMVAGFERYFARSERYALISYRPGGGVLPPAGIRRRIAQWANTPRVHDCSRRLCVGSAAVVPSDLMRGALTALLWFWQPAAPLVAVSTPQEGIAYCLDRLAQANIALPHPPSTLRHVLEREAFSGDACDARPLHSTAL